MAKYTVRFRGAAVGTFEAASEEDAVSAAQSDQEASLALSGVRDPAGEALLLAADSADYACEVAASD